MAADYRPRQAAGAGYVTVSSIAIVNTAAAAGNTVLPINGSPTADASDAITTPVEFQGVGGSLTVDTIDQVTTEGGVAQPGSTAVVSPDDSTPSSSGSTISVGALVATIVGVSFLCLLLIAFVWWKRRKSRIELMKSREKRRLRVEMNKSFIGGHGYSKETEGPWEDFPPPGCESQCPARS